MVCIHCGDDSRVTNSRWQRRANQVWRRRHCAACDTTFTTIESADYATSVAVQGRDGRLQAFSRDKLLLSLHNSLQHRPTAVSDASALTDTAIGRLRPQLAAGQLTSSSISHTVYLMLLRFDKVAAVHYQAFHGA